MPGLRPAGTPPPSAGPSAVPRPSAPALRLLALAALLLARAAAAAPEVEIEGIEGAERRNVEARLQVMAYLADDGEDEQQIRRLHRFAEDDIRGALEAYGYYAPKIESTIEGEGRKLRLRYVIQPGPPTLLREVRIEVTGPGAGLEELQEPRKDTQLRPGARLQHDDYETTKSELARAAYRNGFLDARLAEHELRVEPAAARADVVLRLETGPRYYFGEVRVAQEGLDPGFITRYVPIEPGKPFNPESLLQAQFVLSDLGYFGSVDVQPRRDQAVNGVIPVEIATTPRPPHRYDVSVGYGTDTGARAGLGAEFRQLNRRGHTLRTDLRQSEIKNSIGAQYRVPLGTRAGEGLGFATSYTDEVVGDGESQRYDFTLSLSRTPGEWQRQWYLRHVYEESFVPATGVDTSKLLLPGLSLSRGELDDPIHATRGWSVFLDVHGGDEELVSDVSFLQGRGVLRGVLPLGTRARLLGRAELGGSVIDEFRALPASQRFFAGGDQSVRGYDYQTLAPRDSTGRVIGGKFLTTYSVEAEYRVWGNWGAAAFFDLGNADDDPSPKLYRGAGVGLRYRAPIGTLQLDLAHPFDGEDRTGVHPHLGIRVGL